LEKIDGHQYELVVKDQNGGKSLGELLINTINTYAKPSQKTVFSLWVGVVTLWYKVHV